MQPSMNNHHIKLTAFPPVLQETQNIPLVWCMHRTTTNEKLVSNWGSGFKGHQLPPIKAWTQLDASHVGYIRLMKHSLLVEDPLKTLMVANDGGNECLHKGTTLHYLPKWVISYETIINPCAQDLDLQITANENIGWSACTFLISICISGHNPRLSGVKGRWVIWKCEQQTQSCCCWYLVLQWHVAGISKKLFLRKVHSTYLVQAHFQYLPAWNTLFSPSYLSFVVFASNVQYIFWCLKNSAKHITNVTCHCWLLNPKELYTKGYTTIA